MIHLPRLIFAFALFGALKHLVSIQRLAQWAWRPAAHVAPRRSRSEIIGRVLQAGRWSGVPDRDCVQRSLLLFRELSRAGASPVLVLGARRDDDRIAGHAWVEVDGAVVGEPAAALAGFAPIARFGPRGRLMHEAAAVPVEAPARS